MLVVPSQGVTQQGALRTTDSYSMACVKQCATSAPENVTPALMGLSQLT